MFPYLLLLACTHKVTTIPLAEPPSGWYQCGCCHRPQPRQIIRCQQARDIVSEWAA